MSAGSDCAVLTGTAQCAWLCVCASVWMHVGAVDSWIVAVPGLTPLELCQSYQHTVQSKHVTESGGCISGLGRSGTFIVSLF